MNTIKKIFYTILCIGALNSCSKDDMEVQKNTDLTWKVNKELINNDIRTTIGYDPRYNYIGFENSEGEFPIWTFGELTFSEKTTKQLKVSLDKPVKKEVKLSLSYNPDLFNELKNKYGGYDLGKEGSIKILQNEKVIPVGESSAIFDLEGNFSEIEKKILPFSLNIEGNDSIKKIKGADIFVVKATPKDLLENTFLMFSALDSSEEVQKVFKTSGEAVAALYPQYRISLNPEINIGNLRRGGSGLMFSVYLANWNYTYRPSYGFTINNKLEFINITGGDEDAWQYFGGALQPLAEIIVNGAPYKAEKAEGTKVKLISKGNPDIWFIVEGRTE